MKPIRFPLFVLGILIAYTALSWAYTSAQLRIARLKGVYETPEQGMHALVDRRYTPDRQVKIFYASTDSFDGSKPYVWFVIAEVHASARADGSSLPKDGCDSPGAFFLETKDGWVHVPERAFPRFMGFWMDVFDMAGPGQSQPATTRALDQPEYLCGTIWYK